MQGKKIIKIQKNINRKYLIMEKKKGGQRKENQKVTAPVPESDNNTTKNQ